LSAESLSEHTLDTAFIAHGLAIIAKNRLGENVNPEQIATTALFHDTAEVITGDLPTPVKYYHKDIKNAYKDIEFKAETTLIDMLPEDLKKEYLKFYRPDEITAKYVKAADKISALIKCKEEIALGNREFEIAEKTTAESIKEMGLPAAQIFIEEFLPAMNCPLDENMKL
jgi:5'-deoxynucleotidase